MKTVLLSLVILLVSTVCLADDFRFEFRGPVPKPHPRPPVYVVPVPRPAPYYVVPPYRYYNPYPYRDHGFEWRGLGRGFWFDFRY